MGSIFLIARVGFDFLNRAHRFAFDFSNMSALSTLFIARVAHYLSLSIFSDYPLLLCITPSGVRLRAQTFVTPLPGQADDLRCSTQTWTIPCFQGDVYSLVLL